MYQRQQNLNNILISTICYSDIFDYPLDINGIEKFIIGKKLDKKTIYKTLQILLSKKKIYQEEEYYCLQKRKEIITKFKKNILTNEKKIEKAKRIISILKFIPTISLIGISGSLALNSASPPDDIDLFIISKKNTLWTTRFLVIFILKILGVRREKNSKNTKDKICANMFMDESNLVLPVEKQNLYTAHEIAQMRPLFFNNNMYQRFLYKNRWIVKFLPQALKMNKKMRIKNNEHSMLEIFLTPIEFILKVLQKTYMKKSRTSEIIKSYLLAFHPNDQQNIILEKFDERIKKYAI